MDKHGIGNKKDLSSVSNDLEKYLVIDDNHKDIFYIPFDQSMDPYENLRIINQNFQSTSCSLDFETRKLNPYFF